MKIGFVIAQSFWNHFSEIYTTLNGRYETSIFQMRFWPYQLMSGRINGLLLRNDLWKFMHDHDLTFFEWSEELFVQATHLPKTSIIVTRLHSHELWDFADRVNWENVDLVILVSYVMQHRFLKRFPQMSGRTTVVHNGVKITKFAPTKRSIKGVIGTLSRIDPYKRIIDLVLAFYQLQKKGYELTLRIGGESTESRYSRYDYEVRNLINKLGLEKSVFLQGTIVDTPSWFQGIDIFVSNSCTEGLQVSLLEAMASGCYCLSYAWDGVEEVLPPTNIYLTENELLEKVSNYCSASEEEKLLKQAQMRSRVEDAFDIDEKKVQICQILENLYASKTSEKPSSSR